MDKIGFLITAYHKQEQLIRLINCLGNIFGYNNIYCHIDKKSHIEPSKILQDTSNNLNIFKEIKVFWGGFSQLLAIQFLIKKAMWEKQYQHLVLLSGQDMPVVCSEKLLASLEAKKGKSLLSISPLHLRNWNYNNGMGRVEWFWLLDHISTMRGVHRFHQISHKIFQKLDLRRPSSRNIKFYGGSDWWILPGEVALYCAERLDTDHKLRQCFKYSFIPTEMYFHTAIMASKFADTVLNNNYRFISWSGDNSGRPSPIDSTMIAEIISKDVLFARKFDIEIYPEAFMFFEQRFCDPRK